MTIKNVGIDIAAVKRFRKLPHGRHRSFYRKIFTPREIKYCLSKTDPYEHFTARFAGKEAVLKALGKSVYRLKQFEILNDQDGRPRVKSQESMVKSQILVSLSHEQDYAIAIAIVQD